MRKMLLKCFFGIKTLKQEAERRDSGREQGYLQRGIGGWAFIDE